MKRILKKIGNFIQKFYIVFLLILLYLPTAVLMMMSFNKNTESFEWTGFSIEKYKMLFENEDILEAVGVTIGIGLLSALISTVLGTLACIGIIAMGRKLQKLIKTATNIPMLNADIVTFYNGCVQARAQQRIRLHPPDKKPDGRKNSTDRPPSRIPTAFSPRLPSNRSDARPFASKNDRHIPQGSGAAALSTKRSTRL